MSCELFLVNLGIRVSLSSSPSDWPAHAQLEYDFNLEIQNLHNKTDNSGENFQNTESKFKIRNRNSKYEIEISKMISKFKTQNSKFEI